MNKFTFERDKNFYTSYAGLSLIGSALENGAEIDQNCKKIKPPRHGISHADILKSYLGALATGKTDFAAISQMKHDDFFNKSLSICKLPSEDRLRQRLDKDAEELQGVVNMSNLRFLKKVKAPLTPLHTGHIALDMDLFPMDNSNTKKEGVSRTYKQFDGYGALHAYLAEEGWCVFSELRKGSRHCQDRFGPALEQTIHNARALTKKPLLVRLDAGHDSISNRFQLCDLPDVDYLIKWNPRQESPEKWLKYVQEKKVPYEQKRTGKRVYLFSVVNEASTMNKNYFMRRVMRLTVKTEDRKGQQFLVPDIRLEGWDTSLDIPEKEVIKLYCDHATSEQFHSEFKTDLDLERLPSGKFKTNSLVLSCGVLIYNVLRWIGLTGLLQSDSPVRHKAKRRRIRTVMQELVFRAAKLMKRSRSLYLRFSTHCVAFSSMQRVYDRLLTVS